MATGVPSASPYDDNDPYNVLVFTIRQILAGVSTAKIVKVKAVTLGEGDPPGPATVDVQPMVNLLNGKGEPTEGGTIYGIPAVRIQAGPTAIIIDPKVDDIGILICSDRDISVVKETKAIANPGSRRTFNPSDGVFIGGLFNLVAPTQYIQFADDEIKIVGTTKVSITAPTIDLNGNVNLAGNLIGDGLLSASGVELTTHSHSGVTIGGGVSGPPVP